MAKANPIANKLVMALVMLAVIFVVVVKNKKKEAHIEGEIVAESVDVSVLPEEENSDIEMIDSGVEGDTTNDTIRTLTVNLQAIQDELKTKDALGQEFAEENQELKHEIAQTRNETNVIHSRYEELISKISNLEGNLETLKNNNFNPDIPAQHQTDGFVKQGEYPINNRNYVDNGMPQLKSPTMKRLNPPLSPQLDGRNPLNQHEVLINADEDIVWVEPMDSTKTVNDDGSWSVELPDLDLVSPKDTHLYQTIADSRYGESIGMDSEYKGTPFATIARGSTSIDAVSLTALIGRIPIKGQIIDPYKYKALISAENLASNGIVINGLEGAVVGGRVSGDYALSCIKGTIDYVTFTFQDGTISTFPEDDQAQGDGESLGYISDQNGIPCISGQFLSNGDTYLAQQLGITALSTGASAYASAQTTTQTDGDSSNSSVTGDDTKYALGEMASAGLETTSDWLTERQQNAFDAVYAPPASKLTIHFEKEIQINYNLNGRKTNYGNVQNQTNHAYDYSGLN